MDHYFGYYAKYFLEIISKDSLPLLGINLDELKIKLVQSPHFKSLKIKSLNIRRIIISLGEVLPKIFETPFFQPKNLNQKLVETLNDSSVDEMRDFFKKINILNRNSEEYKKKKFREIERRMLKAVPYLQLISSYYNNSELDEIYEVLIEQGLSHFCYEIRNSTLAVIFDFFQNRYNPLKRFEQFQIGELLNYLPTKQYVREIKEKNFDGSLLDPGEFLYCIANIIQSQGTAENQGRYKRWFSNTFDFYGKKDFDDYYESIFEDREFWDPF
jgi:hypothetical protein